MLLDPRETPRRLLSAHHSDENALLEAFFGSLGTPYGPLPVDAATSGVFVKVQPKVDTMQSPILPIRPSMLSILLFRNKTSQTEHKPVFLEAFSQYQKHK